MIIGSRFSFLKEKVNLSVKASRRQILVNQCIGADSSVNFELYSDLVGTGDNIGLSEIDRERLQKRNTGGGYTDSKKTENVDPDCSHVLNLI